jgi:hypothetical protein
MELQLCYFKNRFLFRMILLYCEFEIYFLPKCIFFNVVKIVVNVYSSYLQCVILFGTGFEKN